MQPSGASATTLQQKLAYARRTTARARLVTQFMFEAEPLLAWERMFGAEGTHLPTHSACPARRPSGASCITRACAG
jgi:hypothetical protein